MGELICPNCQHVNIAGSAFCENCGAQLTRLAAAPPAAQQPTWEQQLPPAQANNISGVQIPVKSQSLQDTIPGRFVIQDSQVSLPIPPGKQEIILGREDPVSGVFPDIDLDPHGGHEAGVGRRHARLILKNGLVYLEDLDSVNGTAVNRQRITARQSMPLKSGDEVRLGKMALLYFAS
jgi:pSer/pThr/pTyr-binding forkhead associated (FHA) protein